MSKILLGFADWNNYHGHLADYGIVIENNISISDWCIADEGGLYLNLVGAGGCRGTKWDRDPRWPKFLGRETLDACAAKCARDDACTAIHALRQG